MNSKWLVDFDLGHHRQAKCYVYQLVDGRSMRKIYHTGPKGQIAYFRTEERAQNRADRLNRAQAGQHKT